MVSNYIFGNIFQILKIKRKNEVHESLKILPLLGKVHVLLQQLLGEFGLLNDKAQHHLLMLQAN